MGSPARTPEWKLTRAASLGNGKFHWSPAESRVLGGSRGEESLSWPGSAKYHHDLRMTADRCRELRQRDRALRPDARALNTSQEGANEDLTM